MLFHVYNMSVSHCLYMLLIDSISKRSCNYSDQGSVTGGWGNTEGCSLPIWSVEFGVELVENNSTITYTEEKTQTTACCNKHVVEV